MCKRDTGIHIQDLPAAIVDRGVWYGVVKSISAEVKVMMKIGFGSIKS